MDPIRRVRGARPSPLLGAAGDQQDRRIGQCVFRLPPSEESVSYLAKLFDWGERVQARCSGSERARSLHLASTASWVQSITKRRLAFIGIGDRLAV
jgi:hypothetical protein